MSPLACRYCIAQRGLKGSEIASLPKTEEELYQHIESEHHVPVRRAGETEAHALYRFFQENPAADGGNCPCTACAERRAITEHLRRVFNPEDPT